MVQRMLGTGWLLFCMFAALPAETALALTYTVTSTADSGTNTLRWAIQQANAHANAGGQDIIDFSLPAGSTITLSSGPEIITDPVIVDGDNSTMVRSPGNDAFVFSAALPSSVIRGLAIVDSSAGIRLLGSYTAVYSCMIGTTFGGASGRGNSTGVADHGSFNTIGSPSLGRNIISGNTGMGIFAGGTNLTVQNCYIGTDIPGTAAIPNAIGVYSYNAKNCLIGGAAASSQGNVISGNTAEGILWEGSDVTGNTIAGNVIGLNDIQTAPLPNQCGIRLRDTNWIWIGLPLDGRGNVIAGNTQQGVLVEYGSVRPHHILVYNNRIGINDSGIGWPNQTGIALSGANNCQIGGLQNAAAYERNVISGNLTYGVSLSQGIGNTVAGNFIGTSLDGSGRVPNNVGVLVMGSGILVGGPNTDANHIRGNLISGNTTSGVACAQGYGNTVAGNCIGLNLAQSSSLGSTYGIQVANNQTHNLIGGAAPADRNVIAGHQYGIYLTDADRTRISGNYLGVNSSGTSGFTNQYGVYALVTTNLLIGGSAPEAGNIIISAAGGRCIYLEQATGTSICANYLQVYANNTIAPWRPASGIHLLNSWHTWIGVRGGTPSNLIAYCDRCIYDAMSSYPCAVYGNTVCASAAPMQLDPGHTVPVIATMYTNLVGGTATAGDYIEVFKAEPRPGAAGGSLQYLGSTTTAGGSWSVSVSGLAAGEWVCAIATNPSGNSSEYSTNRQVIAPPTPSATATPTVTLTSTITPTPTISPTRTATPTQTQSRTVTPTSALAGADLGGKAVVAYPNPAKDRMTFVFHLETAAKVEIRLYNLAGEQIAALSADFAAGQGQSLAWNVKDVAAGVYVARLLVNGGEKAKTKVAVAR